MQSPIPAILAMKTDWDDRARENAKWYIATIRIDQSDEDFDRTGGPEVEKFVLSDPLLTRYRDLKTQRLLEIGCGIGRMSRHFARYFAEVHGTDVSGEMVRQARERLSDLPNVTFTETSGADFAALPSDYFDLIFSVYVFQHVPLKEVVESNLRDASRVLRPGGLFKFQVNNVANPDYLRLEKNTWDGVTLTESDLRRAAMDNGLRLVWLEGLGTQYCWAIYNRLPENLVGVSGQVARPAIEYFSRSAAPECREVPIAGDFAWLTLIVSGLDHRIVDANSLTVELGDHFLRPCYTGWLGAEFESVMNLRGWSTTESLTQVNVAIPWGVSPGEVPVRLRYLNNSASDPVMVTLLEAPPAPPRVTLVANDLDGGLDLANEGPKSRFRVFATGLDETATVDNVSILIDDLTVEPLIVRLVPSASLYLAISNFPDDILPGHHSIRLKFGELVSNRYLIDVADTSN